MLTLMDRFQYFFLSKSLERDLQWSIPHRLPDYEFDVLNAKTHTSVTQKEAIVPLNLPLSRLKIMFYTFILLSLTSKPVIIREFLHSHESNYY